MRYLQYMFYDNVYSAAILKSVSVFRWWQGSESGIHSQGELGNWRNHTGRVKCVSGNSILSYSRHSSDIHSHFSSNVFICSPATWSLAVSSVWSQSSWESSASLTEITFYKEKQACVFPRVLQPTDQTQTMGEKSEQVGRNNKWLRGDHLCLLSKWKADIIYSRL